ncbi:uncharacterized protein BKA78DRAFT_315846 [Phyllosticta capitalensis]|uniref:uncharacterized protein n=1 Tax=Phyllosticta capitalensis TaxID=121624 RepID=UPI00312D0BD7
MAYAVGMSTLWLAVAGSLLLLDEAGGQFHRPVFEEFCQFFVGLVFSLPFVFLHYPLQTSESDSCPSPYASPTVSVLLFACLSFGCGDMTMNTFAISSSRLAGWN